MNTSMENKRKFNILDESESSERYSAGSLFKKHKASNETKGQPTNSTTTNSTTTNSTTTNSTATYSTASAEAAPVSTSKTASATSTRRVATTATSSSTSVQQLKKEMKTGSNFAETFAFLKNSDMYELPPAPTVPEGLLRGYKMFTSDDHYGFAETTNFIFHNPRGRVAKKKVIPKNTNAIIVSPKQRGNPILKHIRNVPWEYGESLADYEMGKTTCALFLSLRYHNLNPDYIHERLKVLGKSYDLRVLLVQVDVQKSKSSLKQLGKISILTDCTLILAWSPEEAGRYLETYKQYENKPPDILQERVECEYLPKMQDVLTTIKSVNKTDVITLLSTFGSLKNLVEASVEEISLCPGFGPQKASRVYQAFFEPFKIDHTIRMAKLDELNKPSQLKKPQLRSPQKKQKTITDFASSSKTSDEQNIEKLLEEDFNVDLEVASEPSVENTSGDLFKNDTAIPSKLKSSDDKSYLSKSDAVMSSALSRHRNAPPKKNILGKPTTSYASPKKSDPFSHSKITEKLTKKLSSPSKRQTNVRNTTKAKRFTKHLGDKKLSPVKFFINTASHGSRETSTNKISSAPQIRKSTRNSATTSNKKPNRASLESMSQSTDQLVQQHTMISNEEYHDLLASSSGSDNDEE